MRVDNAIAVAQNTDRSQFGQNVDVNHEAAVKWRSHFQRCACAALMYILSTSILDITHHRPIVDPILIYKNEETDGQKEIEMSFRTAKLTSVTKCQDILLWAG